MEHKKKGQGKKMTEKKEEGWLVWRGGKKHNGVLGDDVDPPSIGKHANAPKCVACK